MGELRFASDEDDFAGRSRDRIPCGGRFGRRRNHLWSAGSEGEREIANVKRHPLAGRGIGLEAAAKRESQTLVLVFDLWRLLGLVQTLD